MNKNRIVIGLVLAVVLMAACTNPNKNKNAKRAGQGTAAEQEAVGTGFDRLSKAQPVPVFDYSQERQTILDVEKMRAEGTTSTTAGYLEGVGLVWWCPSSGAPVPSTYQVAGSQQYVDIPGDDTRERFAVDQGEPTGVYVGGSSGTWTLCLDDNGRKFAKYWEGYVDTTGGVVSTYPADKRVQIQQATFKFTDKPG